MTADIPGLDGRDVEVLFHEGMLTLRGEKRFENESENPTIRERFYGRFERQIALDRDVDDGNIHAAGAQWGQICGAWSPQIVFP